MSETKPAARVREAVQADVPAIARLFNRVYGDDYLYPEFYDEEHLTRFLYDPSAITLVAEGNKPGELVGTASVLFAQGAHTDLVGEFGRLVVDPAVRGFGIGSQLMRERLERVGDRLHVGYAEVRVAHPFSTRISQRYAFHPMGFLPYKLRFGPRREHAGLMVRHFGSALDLRRNHPRIIPEAHALARNALDLVGLKPGYILDEASPPYPPGGDVDLEDLTAEGYAALLRIERGRLANREVFGPLRLQYGMFKLRATRSSYIVARREGRIVGALGFMRDDHEKNVRVFELICTADDVVRPLFVALEQSARTEWGIVTVEIDVSAYAPRMQRTLLEMGYHPAAYVPALAFHDVERLDVIKMYRLLATVAPVHMEPPSPTREIAVAVLASFEGGRILPEIEYAVCDLRLCRGLSHEQRTRLARTFGHRELAAEEMLFDTGQRAHEMFVVLEGRVAIRDAEGTVVGVVGVGEGLGEVALLSASPHSHAATTETVARVATLPADSLDAVVRQRPDIGVILYRNLAEGLGDKLRRADRILSERLAQHPSKLARPVRGTPEEASLDVTPPTT
jgi:CRP-like cAMP-binding protein/GNAT superfamily N-acetyltransferase